MTSQTRTRAAILEHPTNLVEIERNSTMVVPDYNRDNIATI